MDSCAVERFTPTPQRLLEDKGKCDSLMYVVRRNSAYRCSVHDDLSGLNSAEECACKCLEIGHDTGYFIKIFTEHNSGCYSWQACEDYKLGNVVGTILRITRDLNCAVDLFAGNYTLQCERNARIFMQCSYQTEQQREYPLTYGNCVDDEKLGGGIMRNILRRCDGKKQCRFPRPENLDYKFSYFCSKNISRVCTQSRSNHTRGYILSPDYPKWSRPPRIECQCVLFSEENIFISLEINGMKCNGQSIAFKNDDIRAEWTDSTNSETIVMKSDSPVHLVFNENNCTKSRFRIHYEANRPVSLECFSEGGTPVATTRPLATIGSTVPSDLKNVTDTTISSGGRVIQTGALAGGVVGGLIFLVCILLLLLYLLKRKRHLTKKKMHLYKYPDAENKEDGGVDCDTLNHEYAYVSYDQMTNTKDSDDKHVKNGSVSNHQDSTDYQEFTNVTLVHKEQVEFDHSSNQNSDSLANQIPKGTMLEDNDFYSSNFVEEDSNQNDLEGKSTTSDRVQFDLNSSSAKVNWSHRSVESGTRDQYEDNVIYSVNDKSDRSEFPRVELLDETESDIDQQKSIQMGFNTVIKRDTVPKETVLEGNDFYSSGDTSFCHKSPEDNEEQEEKEEKEEKENCVNHTDQAHQHAKTAAPMNAFNFMEQNEIYSSEFTNDRRLDHNSIGMTLLTESNATNKEGDIPTSCNDGISENVHAIEDNDIYSAEITRGSVENQTGEDASFPSCYSSNPETQFSAPGGFLEENDIYN